MKNLYKHDVQSTLFEDGLYKQLVGFEMSGYNCAGVCTTPLFYTYKDIS